MEDAIKELGHLALGTRLKRLGDRLQMQTQVILDGEGVPVPASHLPPLACLKKHGAMTVGDLSRSLGVRQPGVTRMARALEDAGLIRSGLAEGDRRARVLDITPAGQDWLVRLEEGTFPWVEAAVREACGDAAGSLLDNLAALEEALEQVPLAGRTLRLSQGER
ncbi:MAG: MarR family transcriptional regulator [Holophaga sp.]|nr:MarR family transcriptional regulator [Holophaga sp.]